MNLNCTITVKQQLNTEFVTGLHPGVYGSFSGLHGDVSGVCGDVSGIIGDPSNIKDGVDVTGWLGDVTFYPRRKPFFLSICQLKEF